LATHIWWCLVCPFATGRNTVARLRGWPSRCSTPFDLSKYDIDLMTNSSFASVSIQVRFYDAFVDYLILS